MRQIALRMLAITAIAAVLCRGLWNPSQSASSVADHLWSALSSLEVGQLQAADAPKSASAPAASAPAPATPAPGGMPGGFRFPTPAMLDALDTNHDGELDADEIAKAISRLKSLDKNKDAELSTDELGLSFPGGPGQGGRGGPGGGPGGFGGPGGGAMMRNTVEVLDKFDEDKDGMLNQQERVKARAFLKEQRASGKGRTGFGGFGGPGGGRGPGGGQQAASSSKPGKRFSPDGVAKYPDAELYDPHVLRTLFFEFEDKDWEEAMEEFGGTDVRMPAKLIVDGKTYADVGLRFHGNTSLHGVPRGKSKSINVAINYVDKKQRFLGHRGFNLLNSHTDPSFQRIILCDLIAGQYCPSPKANLVRVVINGESWGIYVNEEKFNKDFAEDWFGEENGVRFRVPVNFSGDGGLVYQGNDEAAYQRLYMLKGKDEKKKQAWTDLINLCKQLEKLPSDKLETELDRILNIDEALWFLAVDNVVMDDDGYFSRASDYCLYQDSTFGRFHTVQRDSNETFRFGGGPGPGGGGGGGSGATREPRRRSRRKGHERGIAQVDALAGSVGRPEQRRRHR